MAILELQVDAVRQPVLRHPATASPDVTSPSASAALQPPPRLFHTNTNALAHQHVAQTSANQAPNVYNRALLLRDWPAERIVSRFCERRVT